MTLSSPHQLCSTKTTAQTLESVNKIVHTNRNKTDLIWASTAESTFRRIGPKRKVVCSGVHLHGGEPGQLVGRMLDSWSQGWELESRPEGRRIFCSRVNFVCWLLFGVCSTPVLPQRYVNDPSHSAKSAGDRLHLNRHTSLIQWSWSGTDYVAVHA